MKIQKRIQEVRYMNSFEMVGNFKSFLRCKWCCGRDKNGISRERSNWRDLFLLKFDRT